MLKWAGLGFGKDESYRLSLSMKNFVQKNEVSNV